MCTYLHFFIGALDDIKGRTKTFEYISMVRKRLLNGLLIKCCDTCQQAQDKATYNEITSLLGQLKKILVLNTE